MFKSILWSSEFVCISFLKLFDLCSIKKDCLKLLRYGEKNKCDGSRWFNSWDTPDLEPRLWQFWVYCPLDFFHKPSSMDLKGLLVTSVLAKNMGQGLLFGLEGHYVMACTNKAKQLSFKYGHFQIPLLVMVWAVLTCLWCLRECCCPALEVCIWLH